MIKIIKSIFYIALFAVGVFFIIGSLGGFLAGDTLFAFIVMIIGFLFIVPTLTLIPKKESTDHDRVNEQTYNQSVSTEETKVMSELDASPKPQEKTEFFYKNSTSTGTTRSLSKQVYRPDSESKYDYIKSNQLTNDVTVFDFETTGFNHLTDEIIQVGAIKYRKGQIIDSYESLIKPSGQVSRRITKLTGITNEILVDAPDEEDVLQTLHNFIKGETLVAHNSSFDMKFLLEKSKNHQIAHEQYTVIDTLSLARRYIHDTDNHKLATLKDYLNIDALSHNSIEDCRVTGELYFHCKSIIDSQPGYHDGKHYTEYVDDIKNMKRANLNIEAISLLLNLVDEVESEAKAYKQAPAPWYYEQLAILYRKEKMNGNEAEILERYFDTCKKHSIPNGSKHQVLVDRHQKLINI